MTTLTNVDLRSRQVNLTMIPLDELRELRTPTLTLAIQHTYEIAAFITGNELQDQAR